MHACCVWAAVMCLPSYSMTVITKLFGIQKRHLLWGNVPLDSVDTLGQAICPRIKCSSLYVFYIGGIC